MREISIMNNLNCKTQAHVRVCEEEKLEKTAYWNIFIERLTVRYYPRNSGEMDFNVLTCDDTL